MRVIQCLCLFVCVVRVCGCSFLFLSLCLYVSGYDSVGNVLVHVGFVFVYVCVCVLFVHVFVDEYVLVTRS